ncbi:MAG: 1-acyl-sn-glycerol-3-phosphate acyltransferase [Thermoanaerobaculales bacterium]|nr:1-acyl-sn-glycerol-3-phosphate acyltransferase [Thermoanaerobaculales bacterium]
MTVSVGTGKVTAMAPLTPFLYLAAVPVTLMAGFLIWVLSLLGKPLSAYEVVRSWCRILHFMTGVSHTVKGLENVPDGPYVVISNHSSHLDGTGLIVSLSDPLSVVIKRELARIPVWGKSVLRVGFISIDRSKSEEAARTLKLAEKAVREGRHLLFFPEGTRAPDNRLHPFKKGGFHLGVNAQVPLLPIAINGSRRLFPKGTLLPRSGEIEIVIGKPIPTKGLHKEDIPELIARTRTAILEGRRRDPDFVDEELRGPAKKPSRGCNAR